MARLAFKVCDGFCTKKVIECLKDFV